MGIGLEKIKTPYVDAQTLLLLFQDYRKPREHILRLVKKGALIRLKNGFYLIAGKIRTELGLVVPYEQVANLLYGPSYVSLEWALSFYGMIPERVHTVTCITLGRNKEYQTPIATFTYRKIPERAFSVGVTQQQGATGAFLLATAEKALADWVFITCKSLNKEQLKQELFESKRLHIESLHQLDKALLLEIGQSYRNKQVNYLIDLIGVL